MKIKIYVALILILGSIIFAAACQSQEPLVRGYYDEKNDWFVYEWDREGEGVIRTYYDPPNKVKPDIKAYVEYDEVAKDYIYNYEVANEKDAVQLLYNIFVEHPAPIYDAKSPAPEDDWHMGEYRDYNEWHWAKTGGDVHGLPAGEGEKGFSFRSLGLPAIVAADFYGLKRKEYFIPSDSSDTDEVGNAFGSLSYSFEEQYKEKFQKVTRKTLGPVPPPEELKPVEFIDKIISFKHEAFKLGWIDNDGIVNSLDKKLENAKRAIQNNSLTSAKNVLEAFVKEVDAQGCATPDKCTPGKHLNPEAWSLLKYNAQYLIDKL